MKVRLTSIVMAIAIVSVACTSFAQGGGGGQGGNRPGGFGMGQRMGGGMMGMGYNPLQLLGRADVEKDVVITEDQLTKLKDLNTKMQDARRKAMEDMRNNGDPNADRETMMKEFQKLQEKWNKEQQTELEKIVTADQLKRTKEIYVQITGNRIIMDPVYQKELAITDKQKEDIKALQAKQQEANTALRDKVQNQEITREDAQAAREKNNKILDDELGKLLTTEQADKIKAMKGTKTFTPDKEVKYNYGGMQMMGGGRGPGGGNRGGGGGN